MCQINSQCDICFRLIPLLLLAVTLASSQQESNFYRPHNIDIVLVANGHLALPFDGFKISFNTKNLPNREVHNLCQGGAKSPVETALREAC